MLKLEELLVGPKMVPFCSQNGTKIALGWPLGGSRGHLGGKWAPRWSQEGSKSEKVNSFPPGWGPNWEPFLHLWRNFCVTGTAQRGKGRFFFSTEVASLFSSPFFCHFGAAYIIKNSSFALEGLQFSTFQQSQILSHFGINFGGILGTFWHTFGTRGRHLAALGLPRWLKMAPENNTKKSG